MKLDDNTEAFNAFQRMVGSFENKIRAIYNYGYKDGFRKGVEVTTKEVVEKIMEMSPVDQKGSEENE